MRWWWSGHLGARRDIGAAESPEGRRASLVLKLGMHFPRYVLGCIASTRMNQL